MNVWNSRLKCCHHTPTRGDCSVMSSRTSDQQQRRPDGRTCWDGGAAPRADDDWRNVNADDWRRQRRTYSSPPSRRCLGISPRDEENEYMAGGVGRLGDMLNVWSSCKSRTFWTSSLLSTWILKSPQAWRHESMHKGCCWFLVKLPRFASALCIKPH